MSRSRHSLQSQTYRRSIAVLGMGHIGLPTALGLAELGRHVIGADSDHNKIELLKQQQCPFYEPGLQELLRKHSQSGRFAITSDVESAIRDCSILFICVGTPQQSNGEADLAAIEALADLIARNLSNYKLIVQKSTAPPLTGEWLKKTISRHLSIAKENGNGQRLHRSTLSRFDVATNPEFLQEGKALENFFRPDRVICG